MTDNKGYLLPTIIDPIGRRYVCVPIPDEQFHMLAFLGQLDELSYWHAWARDANKQGRDVALVWRTITEDIRRQLDDNEDCNVQLEFRVENCALEYRTSPTAQWLPVLGGGDICGNDGVTGATGATGATGVCVCSDVAPTPPDALGDLCGIANYLVEYNDVLFTEILLLIASAGSVAGELGTLCQQLRTIQF